MNCASIILGIIGIIFLKRIIGKNLLLYNFKYVMLVDDIFIVDVIHLWSYAHTVESG